MLYNKKENINFRKKFKVFYFQLRLTKDFIAHKADYYSYLHLIWIATVEEGDPIIPNKRLNN